MRRRGLRRYPPKSQRSPLASIHETAPTPTTPDSMPRRHPMCRKSLPRCRSRTAYPSPVWPVELPEIDRFGEFSVCRWYGWRSRVKVLIEEGVHPLHGETQIPDSRMHSLIPSVSETHTLSEGSSRNSLGAKSFRSRRQVCHSWSVPGD